MGVLRRGVGRVGFGHAGLGCIGVGGVSRTVGYGIRCGAPLGAYVSVSVPPGVGRQGRIGGGIAGDASVRQAVIGDSEDGIAPREHQRGDGNRAHATFHHAPFS